MPIRFRCAYCTRLLGIARRKAGTVVKCPDCGTELIVPTEVTSPAPVPVPARNGLGTRQQSRRRRASHSSTTIPLPPKPVARSAESLPLFERPDFESLLNPVVKTATTMPPAPSAPPAASAPAPAAEQIDVEPAGFVISQANLTLMAIVVVVLIGLAFASGYLLAAVRLPAA